jgi:glucosamine--fructose-6-phosphate aminotransferase (isomerizing)
MPGFMQAEIAEIPAAAARLLASGSVFEAAGTALRAKDPVLVGTIARGSSDHAAFYFKYAVEIVAGLPVASLGPSLASIYRRPLRLGDAAVVAVSQSGRSPDIVAAAEAAREAGALVLALANTENSPLASNADLPVPLRAGVESSVAATKSFVNSVVAGLAVLAHWQQDAGLLAALKRLPGQLEAALACDWSPLADALAGSPAARSLYVLGRGPGLAVAAEAALKFKETCGLHAEAYSTAEVLHGPARLVEQGFPILGLLVPDAAEESAIETVARLAGQGALAFSTGPVLPGMRTLPVAPTGHPLTEPLSLVVSFYAFVERLSRALGFDPDRPPHLSKVTRTR